MPENAKAFPSKPPVTLRVVISVLVAVSLGLALSCGGGGGGGNGVPSSPPTITAVSVTCSPTSVQTEQTSQCTAAVTGTGSYSSAVTWGASAGTINSSGLLTAPATASTVTITATSTQDTSKSGTATVTVTVPVTITSVSVTCSPTSVQTGQTSQCTGTVTGTGSYSSAVTWGTSAGTINSSGLLTAPATASTVTVTATSVQDTSKTGSTVVTVTAAPTIIGVSITPTSATLGCGTTQQFSATVSNSTNQAVTWQVNGVTGGNSTEGAISANGLYTAPSAVPNPASVTVSAIPQADPTKSASATVTIVNFTNTTLNGTYVFTATLADGRTLRFVGGTFQADGAGNLTNGMEDVIGSGGVSTNQPFSGTYSVGPGGLGSATVNLDAGGTDTFAFALASSAQGQFIEYDGLDATFGVVRKQDASAISALAGTFIFSLQGTGLGIVGSINLNGSANVSGTEDINDAGSFQAMVPFTGTYSLSSQGHGTATWTNSNGTSNFVFYIIDGQTVEFLSIDSGGAGQAIAQEGGLTFGNSSLGGSIAFFASGVPIDVAGILDTDAAGNINAGILDEDSNNGLIYGIDGTPVTGTYNVAANGRGTANLIISSDEGVTVPLVFWLASAGSGVLLETDGTVLTGAILAQQGGPFTTSSMQGNFAFGMNGGFCEGCGEEGTWFDSVGQFAADGAGNLAGTEDYYLTGVGLAFPGVITDGSYSIAANGRGTGQLSSGSLGTLPLIFYLVNPAEAIMLSATPALPLVGLAEKQ